MKAQKTVRVKVIQNFRDRENDLILREAGTEYEVTEERAKHLTDRGFAERLKDASAGPAADPLEGKKTAQER